MEKAQFIQLLTLLDAHFDSRTAKGDGKLTQTEVVQACNASYNSIVGIFPDVEVIVAPYISVDDDFAGYEVWAGENHERIEFDFGGIGIDVV